MTTTSSSESRVIGAVEAATLPRIATPDLRSGHWTRHSGVGLGDRVTEDVLGAAAEEARRVARAQGWSAGWADGMRAARDAAEQELTELRRQAVEEESRRSAAHRQALATVHAAAAAVERRTADAEELVTERAVALALAVTEAVLGHAAAAQAPLDVVRRALAAAGDDHRTPLGLRLAPEAVRALDGAELPTNVTLRADATLAAGDAVVDLDDAVVDLRVHAALERVREVLA